MGLEVGRLCEIKKRVSSLSGIIKSKIFWIELVIFFRVWYDLKDFVKWSADIKKQTGVNRI